jgi:hypothetical protein
MEYAYRPKKCGSELPADLLSEVERVYSHVGECLAEMAELTDGPLPERFRYTRARYRISNASLKRRQLFDRICTHLEGCLSSGNAARLRTLRQNDRDYLRHSAGYVTKWTPDAVFASWPGYSKEAKDLQRHMEQVLEEQLRLLTTLLMRHGYAGRRSCHLVGDSDGAR